ncbi:MAG: hypothetical protein JXA10_14835, partial [Anaerolineae bacterium]|nr:hypothetical protein [Anaerolineae bacterium]
MNVFVMMPFQDSFRQVYEEVIAPVVRENDMEPVVLEPGVGRAVVPGPIDAQIIDAIKTSYFCIADLTGNNPNVMYEVAYAHALGKKVILITMRVASDLPVDVRHHGAIEYSPDNDYETLRVGLHRSIREFLDAGGEEIQLLRRALTPASIDANATQFVVATNPRSYRAAFGRVGGQGGPPRTFSDYVGIRGLMQSFGSIYGLGKLPELLNPDDFNDRVFDEQQWINLYTIGSPKSNRWTGMLMAEFFANHTPGWEFKPDPESNEIMNPRVIVRQGGESYVIEGVEDVDIRKWDFGLVIRGPHPK